jgi:hypothetical protein
MLRTPSSTASVSATPRATATAATVTLLLLNLAAEPACVALPAGWAPKAAIEAVLAEVGFEKRRGGKCSVDDYVTLLAAFGRAGVHFKG